MNMNIQRSHPEANERFWCRRLGANRPEVSHCFVFFVRISNALNNISVGRRQAVSKRSRVNWIKLCHFPVLRLTTMSTPSVESELSCVIHSLICQCNICGIFKDILRIKIALTKLFCEWIFVAVFHFWKTFCRQLNFENAMQNDNVSICTWTRTMDECFCAWLKWRNYTLTLSF